MNTDDLDKLIADFCDELEPIATAFNAATVLFVHTSRIFPDDEYKKYVIDVIKGRGFGSPNKNAESYNILKSAKLDDAAQTKWREAITLFCKVENAAGMALGTKHMRRALAGEYWHVPVDDKAAMALFLTELISAHMKLSQSSNAPRVAEGADKLTDAQKKVADFIADGLTQSEIARELIITVHTVRTHKTAIRDRLGIKGTQTRGALKRMGYGRRD